MESCQKLSNSRLKFTVPGCSGPAHPFLQAESLSSQMKINDGWSSNSTRLWGGLR